MSATTHGPVALRRCQNICCDFRISALNRREVIAEHPSAHLSSAISGIFFVSGFTRPPERGPRTFNQRRSNLGNHRAADGNRRRGCGHVMSWRRHDDAIQLRVFNAQFAEHGCHAMMSGRALLARSLPNMQVTINLHKGLFITTYWSMSGTLCLPP
jgi:hypothetical protein